jgi:carbon storage regulator
MLVLSRKPGEKVMVRDDIVVTVVEVTGNRVRIGIEAPEDVRILREELAIWRAEAEGDARVMATPCRRRRGQSSGTH